MTAKVLNFKRPVNGVLVEQRRSDGYVNATAMSKAHQKESGQRRDVSEWLSNERTQESIRHLSLKTGIPVFKLKETKPGRYGGTYIHPKLAVRFAIWLSDEFGYLVEQWVEEWMLTGQNPIHPDIDQEFIAWQERYDIRMYLKDFLRPELMKVVVEWAEASGKNPRTLCAQVHDAMNERIQGARSQQIRLLGGLPMSVLIRDYFGAAPLVGYAAINKLAANAIQDRGIHPLTAIHEACDSYLGKRYIPALVPILENVHARGRRLRAERQRRQASQDGQMTIDFNQAS